MTTLGPATFRRTLYRNSASSTSLVHVDESLGLIDDYLIRPAAQLGLMMMGHCTAWEAEEFFAKMGGMTPSVSTLRRMTLSMHERGESNRAGDAGHHVPRRGHTARHGHRISLA